MARRTRLQQAKERAGAARRRQERVNGEATRQREAEEAKARLEALRAASGQRLERQTGHAEAKVEGMRKPIK